MEEPFDVAFDWLSKVVIYLRQEGTFDLVSKRVRQGIKKKKKKAFISHTFIYVWQPAYAFFRPRSCRPAQNCSHRSKYLYRCRQMQAAEREGRLTVKGGINSLGVEVMNNRDYHRC